MSIAACILFDPGRLFGADDFLPVLAYVLAQGDTLELDTETEYMVELLDPSLLHGEGNQLLLELSGGLGKGDSSSPRLSRNPFDGVM